MMDENQMAALGAAMDGEAAKVRAIGRPVKLSQCELMVLVNLARLACTTELVQYLDEPDLVSQVEQDRDECVAAIHEMFDGENKDGLYRLVQSGIAMLGQKRFQRYLVQAGDSIENDESNS